MKPELGMYCTLDPASGRVYKLLPVNFDPTSGHL